MFGSLTPAERMVLSRKLASASRELIAEKLQLRRTGDEQARALYGVVADDYMGAIDDVQDAWLEVLGVR